MVVPFGTSFPLGFMKILCFIAVGVQKCMLNTLKKRYGKVFWDGFVFRHSASDSFPSLQLADRLCSDITHISISMYASPLPSLDIRHDHWTLARQATWQHLFTGLPPTIYCTSMGKHLWAASLDTARSLCKLAFGVVHKLIRGRRNMKCVHRSTTEVCNVTWSVFTDVQQKCAT